VVGYIRVSSKNKRDQVESRPAQERAIRAWAKAEGHKLVGVYTDEGVSGANGIQDRVGLPEAMEAVTDGHANGLVVRELDRLHRDLMVQEQVFADLWRLRPEVQVYSTKAGEQQNCVRDDPEDPSRRFVRHVLGAAADYNRAQAIARMRAGKRRKRAAGGFVGGVPPFGWRSQDRELVEDPTEQATLARIRELHGQDLSLRAIAAVLHAEGHQPRRGQRWHPNTLARILDRESYGREQP
jgi:DNA invertase Pin-like site-specific DNA recombinase